MHSETKNMFQPIFRKLQNSGRFYCIVDQNKFVEVYFIGLKKIENTVVAHQYPEMLRIKDMIEFELGFIEMTTDEIETHFPSFTSK